MRHSKWQTHLSKCALTKHCAVGIRAWDPASYWASDVRADRVQTHYDLVTAGKNLRKLLTLNAPVHRQLMCAYGVRPSQCL